MTTLPDCDDTTPFYGSNPVRGELLGDNLIRRKYLFSTHMYGTLKKPVPLHQIESIKMAWQSDALTIRLDLILDNYKTTDGWP